MASEIIPLLTKDGRYTSVSIDDGLFNLLSFDFADKGECRAWIRQEAKKVDPDLHGGLTICVRARCLNRVARPSLVRASVDALLEKGFEEP